MKPERTPTYAVICGNNGTSRVTYMRPIDPLFLTWNNYHWTTVITLIAPERMQFEALSIRSQFDKEMACMWAGAVSYDNGTYPVWLEKDQPLMVTCNIKPKD